MSPSLTKSSTGMHFRHLMHIAENHFPRWKPGLSLCVLTLASSDSSFFNLSNNSCKTLSFSVCWWTFTSIFLSLVDSMLSSSSSSLAFLQRTSNESDDSYDTLVAVLNFYQYSPRQKRSFNLLFLLDSSISP